MKKPDFCNPLQGYTYGHPSPPLNQLCAQNTLFVRKLPSLNQLCAQNTTFVRKLPPLNQLCAQNTTFVRKLSSQELPQISNHRRREILCAEDKLLRINLWQLLVVFDPDSVFGS